jgi:SnoaL-like domain
VVVQLDSEAGRVALPFATVADRRPDGRIDELRLYHSLWALVGHHARRPPLLQPDPEVRLPDVIAAYQRALAAGDVEGVVATFEPDGCVREPAGAEYVHRGPDALRAFYERMLSSGGVVQEHCSIVGDERSSALEYNVVAWGSAPLVPQAGLAVYDQGENGGLAALRVYDDVDGPPTA